LVVVAWVSRHDPLPAQIEELERKLGKFTLVRITRTFTNADEVIEQVRQAGARIAVVVLPLAMIAQLVERDKTIKWLMARMREVEATRDRERAAALVFLNPKARTTATYADGSVKVFEFEGFEVIKRVVLETEPWL